MKSGPGSVIAPAAIAAALLILVVGRSSAYPPDGRKTYSTVPGAHNSNAPDAKAKAPAEKPKAPELTPSQKRLNEVLKTGKMPVAKSNLKKVEITGEVIDAWCYVSETMGPGRGKEHLQCATLCAVGGMPLGIVEEKTNNVYIAAKSAKPYTGCFDLLKTYIAKTVKVRGWAAEKGGCRVLRIESVTPVHD